MAAVADTSPFKRCAYFNFGFVFNKYIHTRIVLLSTEDTRTKPQNEETKIKETECVWRWAR